MKTKTKMTQSKLAEIVGVSRQLVAFHVKTGKAPKLDDIDGWLEHLAAVGKDGSLPPELRKKIAQQRYRLLKANADKAEMEHMLRRKEAVEFEFVEQFIGHMVDVFFAEIERMRHEFPVALKGRTEVEISKVVGERFDRLAEDCRRAMDKFTSEHKPASDMSMKN